MCCKKERNAMAEYSVYYSYLMLMYLTLFNPQLARGFLKQSEYIIGTLKLRLAEAAPEPAPSRVYPPFSSLQPPRPSREGRAGARPPPPAPPGRAGQGRSRAGRAVSNRGRVGKRRRAPREEGCSRSLAPAAPPVLPENTP